MFYRLLLIAVVVISSLGSFDTSAQNIVDAANSLQVSDDVKGLLNNFKSITDNKKYKQGLEFGKKLNSVRDELKIPKLESNITDSRKIDINRLLSNYHGKLNGKENKSSKLNKLLIFISSSMPEDSLIALDEQAKRAGGLLVLRGLINGSFKDTAAYITSLSDKGISAIIDPRLFKMFNVEAVPTFIVKPDDSNPCFDKECRYTPIHDKVAGNITLEYALELISTNGSESRMVASSYLANLRGAM